MAYKTPEKLQLVLTENDGTGRIAVGMEAFFEFSFDLAEDLEDLVTRWAYLSPRRSAKPRRTEKNGWAE
jgi:hypothetical protein